jgi:hypothetical protein
MGRAIDSAARLKQTSRLASYPGFTHMKRISQATLLVLVTLFAGAGVAAETPGPELNKPAFRHEIANGPVPWTHEDFDGGRDKFTFAIFSDLTGSEREGVFSVAVEQLRLLRPEFIVNVGDLIAGETTDRAQIEREWDSFDSRAARNRAPMFYAGGNHDLSNPVMWDVWAERYGPRYYHFLYKDVLFLVLDTEDNTREFQQRIQEAHEVSMRTVAAEGWGALPETPYGKLTERFSGRVSADQAAYFRAVIARHPEVRWTFVLMHKPAWERPGEEHFASIEAALTGRPYTVFYGHVHSYLHQQRHGRDYIRLATTGGVFLGGAEMAVDHVTLVTVGEGDPDIANIRLSGIFDKEGKIPLNGGELCLEMASCPEQ